MPTFTTGQFVVVLPLRRAPDARGRDTFDATARWVEGVVGETSPDQVQVVVDDGELVQWTAADRLVAVDGPVLVAFAGLPDHVRRLILDLVQHVRIMARMDHRVARTYLNEATHTARALIHGAMVRSPSFESLDEVRAADDVVDAFRRLTAAVLEPFTPEPTGPVAPIVSLRR